MAPFLKRGARNSGSCPSRPPTAPTHTYRRAADEQRPGGAAPQVRQVLPHPRANVDQVPLPFVNDIYSSYDEVGAKRVSLRSLLDAMHHIV